MSPRRGEKGCSGRDMCPLVATCHSLIDTYPHDSVHHHVNVSMKPCYGDTRAARLSLTFVDFLNIAMYFHHNFEQP